jgi:hypothetical protein
MTRYKLYLEDEDVNLVRQMARKGNPGHDRKNSKGSAGPSRSSGLCILIDSKRSTLTLLQSHFQQPAKAGLLDPLPGLPDR